MMSINPYENKRIAVLGLGRSGRSASVSLQEARAHVFAWDDVASVRETALEGGVSLQDLSSMDWNTIDELILSPGIPHDHPAPHLIVAQAKAVGLSPISDIEVLWKMRPEATYIGITGTNGKSTTTALIGHILKVAQRPCEIGGNIGIPVLDLPPLDQDGTYVLEMSSYQLELTPSIHFDVSVILNISPDHLDRHGGLEGYIAAKKLIYANSKPGDTVAVSVDDPHCEALYQELKARSSVNAVPISTQRVVPEGVYVEDGKLMDRGEPVCDFPSLPCLKGVHNWQNALAAYAACKALGIHREKIVEGMRSFPGLAHRQQVVKIWKGIRFVNDSKATNAEAVAQALACYGNTTVHWLVGGRPKEGGIHSLEEYFPNIHHAYVYGEAQDQFAVNLEGKVSYTRACDLRQAVEFALSNAVKEKKSDSVIILSPACSSFDQFRDFEKRGEAFCDYVEDLTAQGD